MRADTFDPFCPRSYLHFTQQSHDAKGPSWCKVFSCLQQEAAVQPVCLFESTPSQSGRTEGVCALEMQLACHSGNHYDWRYVLQNGSDSPFCGQNVGTTPHSIKSSMIFFFFSNVLIFFFNRTCTDISSESVSHNSISDDF